MLHYCQNILLLINIKKLNNKNGVVLMGTHNNNYNGSERRVAERRGKDLTDRRSTTRFSDILGRRCGIDRRLPIRM